MTRVFVGGSRRCSRLNAEVRDHIDSICREGMLVLVGDANGADKAVQTLLFERGYQHVIVYCSSDACRNNVGQWKVRSVPTVVKRRSRAFFAAKDRAMAEDASYGFMIWDGRSKGTLDNMRTLLRDGKPVLVYVTPDQGFFSLRDPGDINEIVSNASDRSPSRRYGQTADTRRSDNAQSIMGFMDS